MPLPLQDPDLVGDLLHRQGDPGQLLVAPAETAVEAVVGAVVGDVERGEEHQAVAVDRLLDLPGRRPDPLDQLLVLGLEEDGGLLRGKALQFHRLGDDLLDPLPLGAGGRLQQCLDLAVIDKILEFVHFLLVLPFLYPCQGRFDLDALQRPELSRQRADHVGGGVDDQGDDVESLGGIGEPHPPDDGVAVLAQDGVDAPA